MTLLNLILTVFQRHTIDNIPENIMFDILATVDVLLQDYFEQNYFLTTEESQPIKDNSE